MFILLLLGGGKLCGQTRLDSLHKDLAYSKDANQKWRAYYKLGNHHNYKLRNIDSAIFYFQNAIHVAREGGLSKKILGRSYWRLNNLYLEIALPSDQLIPFVDTTIAINRSCDCNVYLMESLTAKGLIYQRLGQQEKALEYFNECLELAQASNNAMQIVALYNSIAGSFDTKKFPEKVLDYYFKGLAIADTLDWPLGRSVLFNNIAAVYLDQKKYEEAELYFQEAIELKESIQNNAKLSVSLCQVAQLYIETGRWELAQNQATRGLKLAQENDYANGISICLDCLANLAGEQKDYLSQIQYAKDGLSSLDRQSSINTLRLEYYESIYNAFKALNRYDSAFHYLEKYNWLSDTLQAIQQTEALQQQETNFKLQEANYKNQLLQQQQRGTKVLLQKRENMILFVVLLALIILGWTLWWTFKKAKLNRELDQLVQEKTKALQSSVQKLEKANEELTYFNYITSHDLREPLRNISGFAALLERKLGSLDEQIQELLTNIKHSTLQMDDLIQDVMQYFMITQNELVPEVFYFNDLLKMVREDLQPVLLKRNGHIIYNDKILLRTSKTALFLAVSNLCKNAVHYNESLAPTLYIEAIRTEETLILNFTDNGIGIDPEFQDQIFEMFKRLHSRAKYNGSGLGLAIAKRALGRIGGNISLHESNKGAGSTFTVTLPVSIIEEQRNTLVQHV